MQDTLFLCAKKFLVKLNREISSGEICKKASEIGAAFFQQRIRHHIHRLANQRSFAEVYGHPRNADRYLRVFLKAFAAARSDNAWYEPQHFQTN